MIRFCHTTRVSFPITDSGSAQASVAERETFVTDVDIQLPLELDACGGPDLTAIHFPPPWTVQELEACFVVTDSRPEARFHLPWGARPGSGCQTALQRTGAPGRGEHCEAPGGFAQGMARGTRNKLPLQDRRLNRPRLVGPDRGQRGEAAGAVAEGLARQAMPATRVSVERRLFNSETFGDVFQSLALNGTKVSKKLAHHRQQFRFRRHSPRGVIGDPLPLFNNEAGGGDDPSMYLQPLAVRALVLL
jgi:hypothetical protein